MDTIICLGHFCEIHGPTQVMCTQLMSSTAAQVEIDANNKAALSNTCDSCRLICPADDSSAEKITCLRTMGSNDEVFLSMPYPASQARFAAVRQTCLRALSNEHTFNDSTPMIFVDPSIGTAMLMNFTVADDSARGSVRRYGLICLGSNESQAVHAWTSVKQHFTSIIKNLQLSAKQQQASRLEQTFLRRARDNIPAPKSLASIVGNDRIFVDLHARFSLLLNIMNKTRSKQANKPNAPHLT